MKAIVNVKKSSGYSRYNGLTFDVVEVLNNIVCLSIPSQLDIDRMDSVDFTFNEVIMVDIQREVKNSINHPKLNNNLLEYAKVNKITLI